MSCPQCKSMGKLATIRTSRKTMVSTLKSWYTHQSHSSKIYILSKRSLVNLSCQWISQACNIQENLHVPLLGKNIREMSRKGGKKERGLLFKKYIRRTSSRIQSWRWVRAEMGKLWLRDHLWLGDPQSGPYGFPSLAHWRLLQPMLPYRQYFITPFWMEFPKTGS